MVTIKFEDRTLTIPRESLLQLLVPGNSGVRELLKESCREYAKRQGYSLCRYYDFPGIYLVSKDNYCWRELSGSKIHETVYRGTFKEVCARLFRLRGF